MDKKYAIPGFLAQRVKQADYERWLHRKAAAHVRRDRRRGNATAMIEEYKRAIHDAVCTSAGRDAYTGEDLDWDLIGTTKMNGRKKASVHTKQISPCCQPWIMSAMASDRPISGFALGGPMTPSPT